MSLARALVFGVSARFLLAVAAIAASVTYALLAGSSVAGLRAAEKVLQSEAFIDEGIFARPGFTPFPLGDAPAGHRILLIHDAQTKLATTRTPWPFEPGQVVPGPFAKVDLGPPGLDRQSPAYFDGAPGDWTMVPPSYFDNRFPSLGGQASVAVGTGPSYVKTPAVDAFYSEGAQQVTDGLAFIAGTSVFVGSIVATVATRLEVQARRSDYALLETLGGPRLARVLVASRGGFIVACGVATGALLAGGAFAYLNRTQSKLHLGTTATYAVATLGTILVVATLMGAWSGIRSLRGDLATNLSRRGVATNRFRGPVRFVLVTPRIALTFAVALMATLVTVGVVLGATEAPQRLLDPGQGGTVVSSAGGNPLRGSVPRFAAEHADRFEDVGLVSPEVYVPTVLGNQPVLVRGVHFAGWALLTDPWLMEGRWPNASGEAVVGNHAATRLGLSIGDVVRIPGAYRASLLEAVVVGKFSNGGLEDDELLVGLDDASSLAAVDPLNVHLIRIRNATNATTSLLSGRGIQVMRITIAPQPPAAGLSAAVRADVINTDNGLSTRTLRLNVNEREVATETISLEAYEEGSVTFRFVVPNVARLSIRVNPLLESDVSPAQLRVVASGIATVEKGVHVRIFAPDGTLVAGANVRTPWEERVAETGELDLRVGAPGKFGIEARTADAFGGTEVIGTREAWLEVAHLEVRRVTLQPAGDVDELRGAYDGFVEVINFGGAQHSSGLVVNTTGPRLTLPTNVGGFSEATLTFHGEAPYGSVRVEIGGVVAETSLSRAASAPAPDSRSVMDIIRSKQPVRYETPETRTQRFLEDVFDAVGTAVTVVVLATMLHGATVVWAAVVRESAERATAVRTLRALGATDGQIRVRAAREALLSCLPGVALGLLLTPVAFGLAGLFDLPHAFGHRIRPDLDAEIVARVSAALVAVALLAAVASVRAPAPAAAARRTVPLVEVAR